MIVPLKCRAPLSCLPPSSSLFFSANPFFQQSVSHSAQSCLPWLIVRCPGCLPHPPSVPTPHPPIKRHHLGTRFLPPQTVKPSAGLQVNSRSGPIEREEEQRRMLYRMESLLSRVLPDALTSHLGLSNSSVSFTDETAQTCTCTCTPLS